MAHHPRIITYPDPILKEISAPVRSIDGATAALIKTLVAALKSSPGVGLAAVQIGVLKRVIAVDVTPKHPGHGLLVLINPVITEARGKKTVREGCLSVPEYTANVERAEEVDIKGLKPNGFETVIKAVGFEAIALQHEIDHLDGILFIDRIKSLKRDLFRRKVK